MPGGINTDIGVHYAAFGAIKFVGYSLFAIRLNSLYGKIQSKLRVGFSRMLIGMCFGTIFGYFFGGAGILFYIGLIPLRVFEWTLISKLFYDPALQYRGKLKRTCIEGTITSCLLDIPATLGFLMTGGLWIC